MNKPLSSSGNLFESEEQATKSIESLGEGAVLLRGQAAENAADLVEAVWHVTTVSPFRHMVTPGGFRMSVAMTNCGAAGWVSDLRGYRYTSTDPETSAPWPEMPEPFLELALVSARAGGYPDFRPDACLINRYEPGARLTMHQDKNEADYDAPIVSVSLGLPATFLFGGLRRNDRPRRMRLESGDIVVWGGPARLFYHGVAALRDGEHPLTGRCRINLTFRKAL